MDSKSHHQTEQLLLAGCLLIGILSYTTDTGKSLIYAIALTMFVISSLQIGVSFNNASVLAVLFIGYWLISLFSVFLSSGDFVQFPVESFAYPIVALLIAGALWKVFFLQGRAAKLLLFAFATNGAIAFLPFFGLTHLPFLGEIQTGRTVFFTDTPSSAGLLWNVNYFAATQAVGFWLLFVFRKRQALPKWSRWIIYFVGVSAILGSSRSITFAFIASIFAYNILLVKSRLIRNVIVLSLTILAIFSVGGIYDWLYQDETANIALRIYKGLNNREELWSSGLRAADDSIFFGYGGVELVKERLLLRGALTTTVQNAYLSVQLLYGLAGLLTFFTLIFYAFWCFYRAESISSSDVAVFSLLVFILMDSMVRSYLLGGVGVIPFLMVASISYLGRLKTRRPPAGRIGMRQIPTVPPA